ncbi:MAG TPA: hypothetical protein DIW30_07470 [Bacteroidales bacterium]|nr:hypothetical protein [Bacteroidales bacterium]
MTKKDNLAEYILHLWQMEDVVRAFHEDEVLQQNPFLSDLCAMMRAEGVLDSGHTQIAKNALSEAEETHRQLLDDASYRAAAMQLQPSLALLKSKTPNPEISDIEMMFIFLYDIMLLRLQKREISDDTLRLQKQVSRLLAHLSRAYKQMREEECQ